MNPAGPSDRSIAFPASSSTRPDSTRVHSNADRARSSACRRGVSLTTVKPQSAPPRRLAFRYLKLVWSDRRGQRLIAAKWPYQNCSTHDAVRPLGPVPGWDLVLGRALGRSGSEVLFPHNFVGTVGTPLDIRVPYRKPSAHASGHFSDRPPTSTQVRIAQHFRCRTERLC